MARIDIHTLKEAIDDARQEIREVQLLKTFSETVTVQGRKLTISISTRNVTATESPDRLARKHFEMLIQDDHLPEDSELADQVEAMLRSLYSQAHQFVTAYQTGMVDALQLCEQGLELIKGLTRFSDKAHLKAAMDKFNDAAQIEAKLIAGIQCEPFIKLVVAQVQLFAAAAGHTVSTGFTSFGVSVLDSDGNHRDKDVVIQELTERAKANS